MTLTQTEPSPIGHLAGGGLHRLLVAYSPNSSDIGYSRTLTREPLIIGRDPGTRPALPLRHARISRRHAEVEPLEEGRTFRLRDLDSRNGTFLNGKRTTSAELRDGDVIRIGATLILFQFLDAAACELVLRPDPPAGSSLVGHGHALARVRRAILSAPISAADAGARRDGRRQGAGRATRSTDVAASRGPVRAGQLRGAARDARSRASSSATCAAPSPAPTQRAAGCSSAPTAARCSSTRSASCRSTLQAKLLRALAGRRGAAGRRRRRDARRRARDRGDQRAARGRGREGHLPGDLYARLMAYIIRCRALRQRREDILELAQPS